MTKELECECGNSDFIERTIVDWYVNENKERVEKIRESTIYTCEKCKKIIEEDL